eukprot:NODE_3692_length_894_cov_9.343195_g3072_i0.p1 GENE.NODE_3692_length_894_cov_9.343195_g3072_i0~~NODE_3692_length_894_cov_9.343195_g3072_i0.p1  ORF type:complete len:262 (-),score=34.16 NODE_3692_length_894_cov_9.343195_g3072_i0:54-839(-)
MATIEDLWYGTPRVTRFFCYLIALVTCLPSFVFLALHWLYLHHPPKEFFTDLVVWKLQVWRLVTNLGFHGILGGPGTLMTVFNIIFALMWLNRLEKGEFEGKTGDFIWFITVVAGVMTTLSLLAFPAPFMGMGLTMSMVWFWTRLNAEQKLSLFGYVDVSAHWFPWIVVALHALFGMSPVADIYGILAGHTYWVLRDLLPKHYDVNLFRTPQILYTWFPRERIAGGFSAAGISVRPPPGAEPPAPPPRQPFFGGRGRVLGD